MMESGGTVHSGNNRGAPTAPARTIQEEELWRGHRTICCTLRDANRLLAAAADLCLAGDAAGAFRKIVATSGNVMEAGGMAKRMDARLRYYKSVGETSNGKDTASV